MDMDKNGNENCMRGLQCPACGNHDYLKVEIRVLADLNDSGTEELGYHNWDDDSIMICPECQRTGKVSEFRMENQTRMAALMREPAFTTGQLAAAESADAADPIYVE